MTPQDSQPDSPAPAIPRKGMSGGAKLGIGCGIAAAILVVLGIVAAAVGIKIAKKQLDGLTSDYRAMGFNETIQGQKLAVRKEISEPTILLGQLVQVYGNCATNLAIVAQVAELHGNVDGRLYFKGQVLRILPTATVKNGAEITAQSFVNEGKIEGEILESTQVSVSPASD